MPPSARAAAARTLAIGLPSAAERGSTAAAPIAARQVFHGGTDTVLLSVTVTDPSGRPISDLRQADFHVFEDNTPQEIERFLEAVRACCAA